MNIVYDGDLRSDPYAPRYAVAVYCGRAFVGFVPGTYRCFDPVVYPRLARRISLAADARLVAEGLSPLWEIYGYNLRPWDLVRSEPLEEDVHVP